MTSSRASVRRAHVALAVVPLVVCVAAGCSADEGGEASTGRSTAPSSGPATSSFYEPNLAEHPTTYGTLGPGYPDPTDPPAPAGTFTPEPDAWADVHPPEGFRVVVVAAADDPQAATVVAAAQAWAADESVDLEVTTVATPDDNLHDLAAAIAEEPDLIVSTGDTLVDAMAVVTASAPERRFLVVGGELAEPTDNVTSVDWAGAGFRGEGLGLPTTHDPASFTPERTDRAVRAGVAAVLTNWSGFVVWID